MKTTKNNLSIIILFIIALISISSTIKSQTQAPVYLTFVTHNEDAEPYQNFNYYIPRRNIIVQLANIIASRGVKWDFQSDWKFLQAVYNFDTGNVISNTNGKNLIKWLVEDKGLDCDPHAHENSHNYADVAYLHTLLDIIPNKIVGGFLYNQILGGNNWENLENGIYGRVYPFYFWRPDILWGGGTPNHVNDPQNYGAWKPQSMANYYVHDSTKHLTLIGNGCSNKIFDTSNVGTAVQRIRNVVNAISAGNLPDTGFYTATVFMSIGQFNPSQMNKMIQFIDSMDVYVSQGKVLWKSIIEIYNIWNTSYGKKPFWIGCSQIPLITNLNIKVIPEGFYNSSMNYLNMKDTFKVSVRNSTFPYTIVDSAKSRVDSLTFTGNFFFDNITSGAYYIALNHRNSIETWSKTGGEFISQGSTSIYDFTSSLSQAYGNNLILKGTQYCIYSGDVNQDGIVDASDLSNADNDVLNSSSGYISTDVNGDNIIDASDLSIIDNNVFNSIIKITP